MQSTAKSKTWRWQEAGACLPNSSIAITVAADASVSGVSLAPKVVKSRAGVNSQYTQLLKVFSDACDRSPSGRGKRPNIDPITQNRPICSIALPAASTYDASIVESEGRRAECGAQRFVR